MFIKYYSLFFFIFIFVLYSAYTSASSELSYKYYSGVTIKYYLTRNHIYFYEHALCSLINNLFKSSTNWFFNKYVLYN